MGKPQSTGNLVNALAQDSSNNIGIGGAANASFKLQVTGSVNLEGNVTTTGAQFVQNGFYLTNTNAGTTAGYTNLWGATDGIFFGLRNGTGGGKFIFQSATSYDYTFPAATGTLALTSNLSAYLPLTGGTLTGALSGTSASFSNNGLFGGSTNAGNAATYTLSVGLAGTNTGGIQLWSPTNSAHYIQFGDSTTAADNYRGYIGYNHATDTLSLGTASADRLTIASTGAATFSSSVTATVGNFYNTTTNTQLSIGNSASFCYNIGRNTGDGLLYFYGTQSTANGYVFGGVDGERMRITSGGNVGIGVTSPQSPLEVYSTTGYASSWRFGILSSSPDYPTIRLYAYGSNKLSMIGNNGDGSLWFFVNGNLATQGTSPMNISSTGAITMSIPTSGQTLSIFGKNNNWTQEVTGSSTTGQSYGLLLTAGTNSADSTFVAQNQAGNTNYFKIRGDGYLQSQSTYNNTTATGANLSISTSGFFERSTSSIRFKTNVEDLTINTSDILSKMRPIWYRSLGQNDRKDWSWYGFIAEELAELEPRLVNWGYDESSYEQIEVTDDEGNIKKETKLKEDAQLIPDGVQYERITVLLVAEMQKMRSEIEELRQIVATK